MSKKLIIAIDGPAGSGKSTSAKIVAQKLGYTYIDSGAMYRAVTFVAIQKNILDNEDKIVGLAEDLEIKLQFINEETKVQIDGIDFTEEIRSIEVNENVSKVSKIEGVRKALVEKQKKMRDAEHGIVMEGRDITTVVFPDADLKIYLTASIEQRAKRRVEEYKLKGKEVTLEEIKNNIEERDRIDSTRSVSPLTKAPDAIEIDTSKVSIEQQVEIILEKVKLVNN